MKTAIYCRVSTDNQEREGTSLKTQFEACRDYCLKKGYEITHQFNESYSGLTYDRPLLNEMRELIRAQKIDCIVIYCLDRLSRNPTHGVILIEELEKYNVTLEAVTEDINNSELGKLISYIRGFASKLEADKIKERTMRGKKEYLKQGKYPQGTGIGIYGYEWDTKTKKRRILEHESKVVQKMFSMAIRGDSVNKIAIELNKASIPTKSGSLWYPLTVRRVLHNETYTGKTYFGMSTRVSKSKVILKPREEWFLLPDVTPAIITELEFNRAQDAINRSKEARPVKTNSPYLLSGMVRCPLCGSPVSGTTLVGKYRYYKCRGSIPTATRGKICDAHYIKADALEAFVWQRFIHLLASPSMQLDALEKAAGLEYEFIPDDTKLREYEELELRKNKYSLSENVKASLDRQITQVKAKLKDFTKREVRCYQMLSGEDYNHDLTLDAINKLKQKRIEAEKELSILETTQKQTGTIRMIAPKISEISQTIKQNADNLGFTEKRLLLQVFRANIIALPGEYKFTCLLNSYLGFGEYGAIDEPQDAQYAEMVKDIEARYPTLTVLDLVSQTGLSFKEMPYGQALITFEKNLVTIGQTSALLHANNYRCPPA